MNTLLQVVFLTISVLTINHTSASQKTIHITPGAFGNIFDTNVKIGNAQITCFRLREALRKQGHTLQQGESFGHLRHLDYIIFFDLSGNLNDLQKFPLEKRVLFLWEPPASDQSYLFSTELHQLFGKIFTWDDRLVDNKKYFKFHYPQPSLNMIDPVPFKDKKLCSLFACNKERSHSCQLYSERKAALTFFENNHSGEFDLYGIGWESSKLKSFKGYVSNKIQCLSKYKFNICYENTKDLPGYITEKIFDCFVAGCVPIYYGANNITDYVPKNCFIDRRDFASFQEVYDYISSITEEKYNQYLENINHYLKSELAQKFSSNAFVDNFIHVLHL